MKRSFPAVATVASAALLLFAAPLAAQPQAPPAAKRPFTVDDLWALQRVGEPALSPDGTLVAYTVSVYDAEEDKRSSDVWVMPVAGGTARRLTTNKASDSSPAFSPDGKRLAFLSKRDGDAATQLYVLPLDGGEGERVTEMPNGVSSPKWLADGKRIVFVSSVTVPGADATGAADKEKKAAKDAAAADATRRVLSATKQANDEREKSKVKARVTENRLFRYWDHWLNVDEFPHLFVVDLATRKVTDLIPTSRRYGQLQEGGLDFDVAPGGGSVVFEANATEPPYKTLNADLFRVSTSGGEAKNLTADNPADDKGPRLSPDGKTIAYGLERKADGFPDRTRLALLDVATGKTRVLTEGWDAVPADWAFTDDGSTLVLHAEVRARRGIYSMPVSAAAAAPKELVKGGTTSRLSVTKRGEVVFLHDTLAAPAQLAAARLDGSGFRELTALNRELLEKVDMGASRDVTFKGAGGADVQMFVVTPPGFDPKKKYPLVHLVHGGPIGTFGDNFHYRWNAQTFAAKGWVVAMVNFHGSSSFGQAFVESILGAHPDKPFTDVMKATDWLIAQGFVDETRMAAAGGSYGGFLVNWIAGHTDRFKALVSHAGVYSLLGQSASDDSYGRHHSYGGTPFTNLANVEAWSPNRYAAGFKTPMLVLHGERDYRVPVTQGLELYGVLTAKGIPARLVYYPDENHWVLKGQNAKHWHGEVFGWLERWMK